jgi:hypothetical protein
MRVFFTCPVAMSYQIMDGGWFDLRYDDNHGVHLSDCPLDLRHGFEGPVVLCIDVPEELFEAHEFVEEDAMYKEHVPGDSPKGLGAHPGSFRYAIIPATEMNQIGRPQYFDHDSFCGSRKDLLEAIRTWEEDGGSQQKAAELRQALEFLDRIGWNSLVRWKEELGREAEPN